MDLSGEKEPYLGELPGGSPGTESGTAEFFELLRRKGLNDQEIILEIFKLDITADIQEIQAITGLDSLAVGRLKGTATRTKKKDEKEKAKAGEKGGGGAPEEEEKSLLRGEVNVNAILKRILTQHPDVPAKVRDDIMLLAEDTPGGINPQALIGLLLGYKGVTKELANFLALRYSLAVTKAQQEVQMALWSINPGMMGMGQGQGMGGPGLGMGGINWNQPNYAQWPHQNTQPNYGPQSGYGGGYTERDILRLRQDWDKEKKLENLERSVADLVRDLPNTIKNAMPQVEGQYEDVTEYIDKNGKLCGDPEKAFSLRSIRRPITSAPRESSDVRELKEKFDVLTKSIQDKTIGDLERSIKELRDGMGKRTEESPELRELKAQLDQTRTNITELKETMASKERDSLMAKIDSLEDRITHYSTTVGEWKTDEAKLIATELGEIGSIAKEFAKKDRMGLVERIIIPESTPPTGVAAGEEARGGVIDELRKHGFTARIIER